MIGASTLATQIEKFRHSPDGRTSSAREKLRQMLSASLRAYQGGAETLAARRLIVVDYLNSVPLSAAPDHGEVLGLDDGLRAWFGADLAAVNRALADESAPATRASPGLQEDPRPHPVSEAALVLPRRGPGGARGLHRQLSAPHD